MLHTTRTTRVVVCGERTTNTRAGSRQAAAAAKLMTNSSDDERKRQEQVRPSPYFVPGLPHVPLIELRLALSSYQEYHIQSPFRVLLCAALTLNYCHRSIPGQYIAAIGALKSGLWVTAGGKGACNPAETVAV